MSDPRNEFSESYWRGLLVAPQTGQSGLLISKKAVEKVQWPIATSYTRIVIGERGPYVEFLPEELEICKDRLKIPDNQKWRLGSHWNSKIYYLEFRHQPTGIMVYYQKKTVKYADYRVKRCYISPWDLLKGEDQSPLISTGKPDWHY